MHYNYELDENILKTLIKRHMLPTDLNEKIKLIIFNNKFKTPNKNSYHSIRILKKTNVIYQFKCSLGDSISEKNNIYVGLISTTLSRRFTMYTSSKAQHLKKTFLSKNLVSEFFFYRKHNIKATK